MDVRYREKSPIQLRKRPYLLACIFHGVASSSLMPLYVYDFTLCKERHFFFSESFSLNFVRGVTLFYVIGLIAFTVIASLGQKEGARKYYAYRCVYYTGGVFLATGAAVLVLFSVLLSLGNFKKFVPALFIEAVSFYLLLALTLFYKLQQRSTK